VLPELFIVSQVVLNTAPGTTGGPVEITVIPASEAGLVRCPRSWRWVPELVDIEGFEEKVSPRDRDALAAKYPSQ
jgi:isoleucyl-tRNA synthetase